MKLFSLAMISLLMVFSPGNSDLSTDGDRQDQIDKYLQKAYPAAKEGMKRMVLRLPHKTRAEQGAYRVEIVVGKQLMTDGVNRYGLPANIEKKVAQGWGFDYYVVEKLGKVRSTLMGVLGNVKPVKKFVSGSPMMLRYNSRLPVVVYVPKEAEVQYRIFKAGKQQKMGGG